jgi:hypothetical protein
LVIAWHLGERDRVNTEDVVSKIRWAMVPGWFYLITDSPQACHRAIDVGMYDRANQSQVVMLFSNRLDRGSDSYSPAKFICLKKGAAIGMPDLDRAGTSHLERRNGTLRQPCKGLTRLTYAFSKTWDSLHAALPLHHAHHNFCRIHSSLRITPAMVAAIPDRIGGIQDLISTL